MGKKAPTPPAPPDPVATANAQGAANRETAIANQELSMVDQITPYGSLTYSKLPNQDQRTFDQAGYDKAVADYNAALAKSTNKISQPNYASPGGAGLGGGFGGGFGGFFNKRASIPAAPNRNDYYITQPHSSVDRWQVTQTLSPDQQAILDLQSGVSKLYGQTAQNQLTNVSAALSNPIDYSSLGAAPVANEATRTATRDAILQRLQPQFDQRRAALETSLANQGFTIGSEAWSKAIDEANRAQNDAYLAADYQAGNEMARIYGLESSARDRAINELIQQRQIPLNELSAMMTGTQVQGPQFVNTPGANAAPADIMGATYASANLANQNYQQQVAAQNANTQGLFGLLGTAGGLLGSTYGGAGWTFSDRRLKTHIHKIGKLANGLTVYVYRYIWGGAEQVGLMADEVKLLKPWAVKSFGGFDAVNYTEAVK